MPFHINRSRVLTFIAAMLYSFLLQAGSVGEKANDSGALLSVIHSEQLRSIMQRLDSLAYEREYTALELENIRRRRIGDLVAAARELMDNSRQLEQVAPDSSLSGEDLATFKAIASQLYQETLGLEEHHRQGHSRELDEGYERLRDTCNACHRLFRKFK